MSDSKELAPVAANDGWQDAATEAQERVLRGNLLKFADGAWSIGKEAAPVKAGRQLVALATAAAWVRWEDGKPVEYRMREPGHALPEREELGFLDESKWELGPDGKSPKDPFQNTRFVYLVDEKTAEAFTFSTSSWGGRGCVSDLGDQIARMRSKHPGAVPLVELVSAPMQTRFGKKTKPVLKVIGWKSVVTEKTPEKQIAATLHEEMDDGIPY